MQIKYFVLVYNVFSVRSIFGQCDGSAQAVSVGYTSVSFTTPGYPSPGYDITSNCAWLGTSSETGATLLFRVTNINVDCAGDAINVYDGSDDTGTLEHTNECGTTRTLGYQTTSSINVYTTFTSDTLETTPSNEQGFRLYMISGKDFSGTGCSASQSLTATNTEQFISSPNFPDAYTVSATCTWVITATDTNAYILINIKFLNIEYQTSCLYDYLEIKDSGGATIEKVCQENVDNDWNPGKSYTSTDNSITVVFSSDNQDVKNGFLLSYNQTGDSTTTTEDTTETSITLSGSDSTQNATTNVDTTDNGGLSAGEIFGIAASVSVGVALCVWAFIKRRAINQHQTHPSNNNGEAKTDSNCNSEQKKSADNIDNKVDITYPDCIYTMPDCYKDMPHKPFFFKQLL